VSHIDLATQGEAVQQFFRSLAADPEGALVELNGQALARLVPIRAGNGPGDDATWTEAKNSRRSFLIDREIDGTLTPEEARELPVSSGRFAAMSIRSLHSPSRRHGNSSRNCSKKPQRHAAAPKNDRALHVPHVSALSPAWPARLRFRRRPGAFVGRPRVRGVYDDGGLGAKSP
jgi:hypothetical protein